MEKKWNTMLLIIMSGLLSLIAFGLKEYAADQKLSDVKQEKLIGNILTRISKSDSLRIELKNDIKWGKKIGDMGMKMLENHESRLDKVEKTNVRQDQQIEKLYGL